MGKFLWLLYRRQMAGAVEHDKIGAGQGGGELFDHVRRRRLIVIAADHQRGLGDFAKAEMPTVERVIDAVSGALPALIEEGAPAFSTKAALVLKPPQNRTRDQEGAAPATGPAPASKKDKETAVSTALAQALAKAKGMLGGDNS